MSALTSIARSGLDAAALRLTVSGHNVANAQTANFRPQQVAASTRADGGVDARVVPAAEAGVSLADEMVAQRAALAQFTAGVRVLQAQQTMLGTLLDRFA